MDRLAEGMNFEEVQRVDLVICTWNRVAQLKQTVESIFRLIVPYDRALRLIIVNNNSSDGTAEYLNSLSDHRFFSRHRLLVLDEPQQGHTHARNCAIGHLDCDLVMWTDDDVEVDARWLQKTVDFANAHPQTAFFGGKIIANLQPRTPKWIEENWPQLRGCFAERDLGNAVVPLNRAQLPYGANFAVRGAVQKEFLFDTRLGRRADEVLGEDELEIFGRWIDAGLTGNWNPESVVHHQIDATRINEEFVRRYFIGQGRALVKKGQPWHQDRKRLWWTAFGHYLRYRFERNFSPSPAWTAHLIRSGLAEGQYAELRDRAETSAD